MATQTADSPGVDTPPPTPSHRFFQWMRGVNVPRQPGWLGGVCAGVANRLGIDPLIVRGIVVVVAVLGGPAFLLYAAAWLLLPDTEDRIHLERLIKGHFDQAVIGVIVLVGLALLPVAQGFWFVGASYWGNAGWGDAIGRVFWTLLVIAASAAAIVWLARRAGSANARADAPTPTVVPATTDARPDTVPQLPGDTTLVDTGVDEAVTASGPAPLPAPPAAGAPAEELAAWKEQQALWKQEHNAWRQQQAAAGKELRTQRAAEAHAVAVANAAAAAERRRIRNLTNPRLGGGLVAIALGVALLVGGVAALVASSSEQWSGGEVAVGLATATIAVAVAIVAAGAFRRRSGFLGFVAVMLVLASLTASFVPRDRQLILPGGFGISLDQSGRYSQLAGNLNLYGTNGSGPVRTVDIVQVAGTVSITIPKNLTVDVEATIRRGVMQEAKSFETDSGDTVQGMFNSYKTVLDNGDRVFHTTVGSGKIRVRVKIWQAAGEVQVNPESPVTIEQGATQ
jgi:phage shock protein PspC (stress-responsive transcriptional regulator)